tara:strand:- start:313 stop:897 length:585 start_codon:yes stop_codon:yes gene_type:complete
MIKIDFKYFSLVIIMMLFFNCAGGVYKKMSVEDPETLLSLQDSLLIAMGSNQNIIDALVNAHNNVAKKYIKKGDNVSAAKHFKRASELNSLDSESKYGLLISEGRLLVNRGNKNGIWDAIEKFSKASTLYPDNGEPFYWIAASYTELGDTDFDLILESYEKALSLELDKKQRAEAEKKYEKAKERKKKLDSFWK